MYFKNLANTSSAIKLDPAQSSHIATVLRLKDGDIIELFDGEGLSCEASITLCSKRNTEVELISSPQATIKQGKDLIAVLPYIKKDNMAFMTQKLTELGVTKMIFFKPDRLDQSLIKKDLLKLKDKLTEVVIGACKQSGINFLPTLEHFEGLQEVLNNILITKKTSFVCFFDLDATELLSANDIEHKDEYIFISGPESGFSDQERFTMVDKGVTPKSLGKNTLRAETAPIISATLIQSFVGNI